MAYSGTLGAMLQGVSQQPVYLRQDGQVTEQINFLPDITEGITTRPGTDFISRVTASFFDHQWHTVIVEGETFFIGTRASEVIMLNTAGEVMTVNTFGGVENYFSRNMATYVYDNEVYITERDTVVETGIGIGAAVERNVMMATQLGGQFSHTYRVDITYDDGGVITGLYKTPDGTNAGDADKATSTYIMEQIQADMLVDGTLKGTTSIDRFGDVLVVTDSADNFNGGSITARDGEGGSTFRVAGAVTQRVEDLPKYAPNGTLTQVVGENNAEDDIWLRFETTTSNAVGAGLGDQGVWKEYHNPDEPTLFNLSTMPHKFTRTGPTTFDFGFAPWQGRRTGDSNTNPYPSFLGNAIRDIGGFQSRLVIVAGDAVVMSRTNIPVDFFKETAAAEVPTDPIDIISTSETEYELDWVMPFDRDLIILGGNAQFLISGGQALTPANASLVESTNFRMNTDVRPSNTGRSVLFPFLSGSFSGVKEFFSASSVEANEAVTLTQVQDRYIKGRVQGMPVSTSFGLMLMHTADNVDPNVAYAYQYFFDGVEKIQNAWFKLQFHLAIKHIAFEGSRVFVIARDGDEYVMSSFDLDIPIDEGVQYNISLDEKQALTAGSYAYNTTSVTADFGSFGDVVLAVQGSGCVIPGQFAQVTRLDNVDGTFTYLFDEDTVPIGATVYLGVPITKVLKPSMPLFRDREGKPISKTKLNVTDFAVYYENSGQIDAVFSSKYRTADYVFSNATFPVDGDPDDPEQDGLRDGIFNFTWGERSDWSELTLTSTDVRPVTITEIEWFGQILSRGKRV